MKPGLALRIARALREHPPAVERLMERWIQQGRAEAFAQTAAALPKARREDFRRLATYVACVTPLVSDEEGAGVGWILALPTEGIPDRDALATAISQAADPRLWSITLAARPWDATALRQAGPPAWRAALEALLEDREIPLPVAPRGRQIWLLALAGPAGKDIPFPGADIWGLGGVTRQRLTPLLERLSTAARAPVLPPSLLPDVLDWAAGQDALDALAKTVHAAPEESQIHVCDGPSPEVILTDPRGRPIQRIDLTPAIAVGVPPKIALRQILCIEDGPTLVLHQTPDTLPRPGWLH